MLLSIGLIISVDLIVMLLCRYLEKERPEVHLVSILQPRIVS